MSRPPGSKFTALCILCISLLLSGCGRILPTPAPTPSLTPGGPLIPFETIERDKGNGSYESEEPRLVVIRSAAEAGAIQGWVSPEALTAVEQTDYQRQLVVAVFQGWKPVYDYEVQVEQVALRDRTVVVEASFLGPPTAAQHPAESSPYQVIRISKDNLDDGTAFILKANGQEIGSGVPSGQEVAFATLAQDTFGSNVTDILQPQLFWIGSRPDAERIRNLISPESYDRLTGLDFNREAAIAAFRGREPTTGYDILIQRVLQQDGRLVVYAQLWEPSPVWEVQTVGTSSYHIVKISRPQSLTAAPELVLQGQVVTPTPPPAPTPTRFATPNPPPGVQLPFETVERADLPGTGGEYASEVPALAVIASPKEAAALGDTISLAAQDALGKLDYSSQFAIAVFQGIKGSNMYGVEIQRLYWDSDRITVVAHFTERNPELEAAAVQTSPYHIVRLPKAGLQGELQFILNADGEDILSVPARL